MCACVCACVCVCAARARVCACVCVSLGRSLSFKHPWLNNKDIFGLYNFYQDPLKFPDESLGFRSELVDEYTKKYWYFLNLLIKEKCRIKRATQSPRKLSDIIFFTISTIGCLSLAEESNLLEYLLLSEGEKMYSFFLI